jgi:hypothetical protein
MFSNEKNARLINQRVITMRKVKPIILKAISAILKVGWKILKVSSLWITLIKSILT